MISEPWNSKTDQAQLRKKLLQLRFLKGGGKFSSMCSGLILEIPKNVTFPGLLRLIATRVSKAIMNLIFKLLWMLQ